MIAANLATLHQSTRIQGGTTPRGTVFVVPSTSRLGLISVMTAAMVAVSCSSPNPDASWSLSFGGPERDMVYDMSTGPGEIYLAGEFSREPNIADDDPTPTGSWLGMVMRLSMEGEMLWQRPLPGATPGMAITTLPLSDGVLVGGFSGEPQQPWVATQALLAKFTPDGEVVWSKRIARLRHAIVYDLVLHDGRIFAVLGSAQLYTATATDASEESVSEVAIVEFSTDGEIVFEHPVGHMLSQDSSYMLVSSGRHLIYAGDVLNQRSGGVDSEVIAFDNSFVESWRTVLSDPYLVGISALAVGAAAGGGTPVVYVGGHFREQLEVGGRSYRGVSGVRRNGFVAAIDAGGKVGQVVTLLPVDGGDWATVYSIAPLSNGSVLAVGEFLGGVDVSGTTLRSIGDLDSIVIMLNPGAPLVATAYGTSVRDGFLLAKELPDRSVVVVSALGGGRNDPNGEDVLIHRRAPQSTSSNPYNSPAR
jgi:hypothetical protein